MSARTHSSANAPATFASRFSLAQTILTVALTLIGTLLTLGATYGTFISRLGTVEANVETHKQERVAAVDELKKESVPRSEHEAHWKAQSEQLNQIQTDVRELRRLIIEDNRRR
jgi:hypothetical protein